MSRNKKVLRNIVVLGILFFVFLKVTGLYLTPLSAHKNSERSIHYGPSEVIHIEHFDRGKYLLCKYDKWVSCNTVKRELLFFWRFGNQVTGFENDKTKALDYTWGMSSGNYKLYGIINNDKIRKIQITLNNGEIFTETEFYENLFLFTWKADNDNQSCDFNNIKGYDSNNNIICEYEY